MTPSSRKGGASKNPGTVHLRAQPTSLAGALDCPPTLSAGQPPRSWLNSAASSPTSSRRRLGVVTSGCRARSSDLAVGRELDRRRARQRSRARSHCVANKGGLVVEVPPALLRDGSRVPGVQVG